VSLTEPARLNYGDTLLRFPRSIAGKVKKDVDHYITRTIPPEKLEILVAGAWNKLTTTGTEEATARATGELDYTPMSTSAHSPTREEWQVVVTNPPSKYRGSISHIVAPGDAHAVGNSLILGGFYDDEQASRVAAAISRTYGAIASFRPRPIASDAFEEAGEARASEAAEEAWEEAASFTARAPGGFYELIAASDGNWFAEWRPKGGLRESFATTISLDSAKNAVRKHLANRLGSNKGLDAFYNLNWVSHAEEMANEAAEDRPALRWTEVTFALKSDGTKFAKLLEKKGSGVTAEHIGKIVTTNATWNDIQKVLDNNTWEKGYSIAPSARKYDLTAEAGEEGCSHTHPPEIPAGPCPGDASAMGDNLPQGAIPWVTTQHDPAAYAEWIKFGDAFGPIDNTQKVYKLLADKMTRQDQEIFVVVVMDLHAKCKGVAQVNIGERSEVGVDIEQIMRTALSIPGGNSWIACHCHPSGKCRPSKADRDLTRQLEKASLPFANCKFIDHVVIGVGEIYSIKADKKYKIK
jgi:proteasome lid subunit RPN8/RPN11